jgi:hypothetical protein
LSVPDECYSRNVKKFIRYARNKTIGKANKLKAFGAIKPKGLNRIAKIKLNHPFLMEENQVLHPCSFIASYNKNVDIKISVHNTFLE